MISPEYLALERRFLVKLFAFRHGRKKQNPMRRQGLNRLPFSTRFTVKKLCVLICFFLFLSKIFLPCLKKRFCLRSENRKAKLSITFRHLLDDFGADLPDKTPFVKAFEIVEQKKLLIVHTERTHDVVVQNVRNEISRKFT